MVGEPSTSTGASTFASVPLASGFELRPTTTATGAERALCDAGAVDVVVACTGTRTVTRGRPSIGPNGVSPRAVLDPWPTVAPIGSDEDWDPNGVPVELVVTGTVTERNGPVVLPVPLPDVPEPPPDVPELPPDVPEPLPDVPVAGLVPVDPLPAPELFARPAVVVLFDDVGVLLRPDVAPLRPPAWFAVAGPDPAGTPPPGHEDPCADAENVTPDSTSPAKAAHAQAATATAARV